MAAIAEVYVIGPPYIGKLFVVALRSESESNSRDDWRKKARRTKIMRFAAWAHFHSARGSVTLPVVVTLTRIAPSAGLDDDNLRGALKACRDGVADALGVDDRDARVTWAYAQRRGAWGVEVRIDGRP